MPDAPKIAMQNRCIFCGREHWAGAVAQISRGKACCAHCGGTPPVLTYGEWRDALAKLKAKADDSS